MARVASLKKPASKYHLQLLRPPAIFCEFATCCHLYFQPHKCLVTFYSTFRLVQCAISIFLQLLPHSIAIMWIFHLSDSCTKNVAWLKNIFERQQHPKICSFRGHLPSFVNLPPAATLYTDAFFAGMLHTAFRTKYHRETHLNCYTSQCFAHKIRLRSTPKMFMLHRQVSFSRATCQCAVNHLSWQMLSLPDLPLQSLTQYFASKISQVTHKAKEKSLT